LDTLKKIDFFKETPHPLLKEIKPLLDTFDPSRNLIGEFLETIYKTPKEANVPGQLMYTGAHSPFYTINNNEFRVIFCFYNSESGIKVHFFKDVRQEFHFDLISAFIKPGSEKQYLAWISGDLQQRDMVLNLCTFSELDNQTFSWLESILIEPKQTIEIDPTILPETTIKTDTTISPEKNLLLFSLIVLLFIFAGVYMSWSPSTSSGKNKSPVFASIAGKKKKSKHGTGTLAASAFRSAKKKRTKTA